MKQPTKTNSYLKQLVQDLYKMSTEQKTQVWRRVADDLMVPTRHRHLVNVFKLGLYSKDGDVIVVPGKVLGTGDIGHKVTVAAFGFSKSAVDKIKNAKGSVMTIPELVQKNPKGKDVRVFG
jgi:large subunit ribosomal protein L18e